MAWATADPAPPAPSCTTRSRATSAKSRSKLRRNPDAVGVVAAGRAVLEDHGVDGAEDARASSRELVEVLDDLLLERVGDVEPAVAERPGPAEQGGQVVGGQAEVAASR